jgi:hypothetical protein
MARDGPRRDVIAGRRLTLADVVRVARAGATVRLDPAGLDGTLEDGVSFRHPLRRDELYVSRRDEARRRA